MPGPRDNSHDPERVAHPIQGAQPYGGNQSTDEGQEYVAAREGETGPAPEGTAWQQMIGRLGNLFGPQPYANPANRGANLVPAGIIPDPSTATGVVYAHAGQEEWDPSPGPTREIEGNIDELLRGQGANPPALYHVVHHVQHNIEEGNPWWTAGRITVPTTIVIRIVPANPKRGRITILNTDATNAVDLLADANPGTFGSSVGFPLTFGQSIEFRHTREIWAIANASPVTIAYKAEFTERPGFHGEGEN